MKNLTTSQVSDFARNIRGDFSQIPRFGHSRHIELLVSPNKSDQRDYIIGVISFVILIIFLVFLWSILLIYFRCRGKGCAAGQFTYKDENEAKRGFLRRTIVWILFAMSTIILFVTPFFLIRSAFPKIHTAAIETKLLNGKIKNLLAEGYAVTNSTVSLEDSLNSTNLTLLDLRSYCGSTFDEAAFLASLDYSISTNISFSTLARKMEDSAIIDDISLQIITLQDYLNQSETKRVRSLLKAGLNASDTLDHVLHEFLDHDYIMKMFALFLIAIMITIWVLGLLNLCKKNPRSLRFGLFWFILPAFLLFIYFSWAIAMLITVAAVMNSDICFGGQSKTAVGTALSALQLRGDGGGILYNTILYYDSSCTSTSPWDYLNNFTIPMEAGLNASSIVLLSDPTNMTAACGRDITPYLSNLEYIEPLIMSLQDKLQLSMELSSCTRVYPLFYETFNGSICLENIDGLDLSSLLIFCIAVFGMVVITLRSAFYDKRILSMELDETPVTASIPAVVAAPKPMGETPNEPSANNQSNQKQLKQGTKPPEKSLHGRKKKRESAVAAETSDAEENGPSYVAYIYSDPSKGVSNEDFEVVVDMGIGSRSDEYSELSDPSKIGDVKPDAEGHNGNSKGGFFKKKK